MNLLPLEADRRRRGLETALASFRTPAGLAALLSVYAGALHLYVTPEHFWAWWGYGVFFVGVGIAQVLLAVLLFRGPGTATWLAGVAGNLTVVGLYVFSRTSGLPFGPLHSGHRLELAGTLDLTAAAVEFAVIVLLVSLMPPRVGRATLNVLLTVGVGLWVLRLSGLLA